MAEQIWDYDEDSIACIDLQTLVSISRVYETTNTFEKTVKREIKMILVKDGYPIDSNITYTAEYGDETDLDLRAATDIVNDSISSVRQHLLASWKSYTKSTT